MRHKVGFIRVPQDRAQNLTAHATADCAGISIATDTHLLSNEGLLPQESVPRKWSPLNIFSVRKEKDNCEVIIACRIENYQISLYP